MKYWWVTQGSSYGFSKKWGIIYAPKDTRAKHNKMGEIEKEDRIISYANGKIKALSTATDKAYDASEDLLKEFSRRSKGRSKGTPKKTYESAWCIKIQMKEIKDALAFKDLPDKFKGEGGIPVDVRGWPPQSIFLAELNEEVGKDLWDLLSKRGLEEVAHKEFTNEV